MKKIITLSLLTLLGTKVYAKCPAIATSNFNSAVTGLEAKIKDIQIKKQKVYTDTDTGIEESIEYRYVHEGDSQEAFDNYEKEYKTLKNASFLSTLASGSIVGLTAAIAEKLIGTDRISKKIVAGTIAAGSIGATMGINAAHPATPYYSMPDLKRHENFFANDNASTIGRSVATMTASTLVYFGADALLKTAKLPSLKFWKKAATK